jgi:predicted hotdog family 3-hydroxylacyl-ACP dehydratase
MMIGKAEIAGLIPHAGAMCLLDGVLQWDETSIRCVSARHRAPDNPLRRGDRLEAICGVEFAAQAMAVHGRLAGSVGGTPRAGYLASLRDVTCRRQRLDLLAGDLVISAERLMGDAERVIYRFALDCGGIELLAGRAAVVLDAAPL